MSLSDTELARALMGRDARTESSASHTRGVAVSDQEGDRVRVALDGQTHSADGERGVVMACAVSGVKEGMVVEVLLARTAGSVGSVPTVIACQGAAQDVSDGMDELGDAVELVAQDASEQIEQAVQRAHDEVEAFRSDVATTYTTTRDLLDSDSEFARTFVTEYTNPNKEGSLVTTSRLRQGIDSMEASVTDRFERLGVTFDQQAGASIGPGALSTYVSGVVQEGTTQFATKTEVQQTASGLDTRITQITNALTATAVDYAAGGSGTSAPTSGWQSTVPSVPQGQWLWCRVTYTDGTTAYSCAYQAEDGTNGTNGTNGRDGRDGTNGTNGVGISSIVTQYYLSTSSTTQTGGSWSTSQPAWSQGKYIWVRSHITWDNGSTSTTSAELAKAINGANQTAYNVTTLIRQESRGLSVGKVNSSGAYTGYYALVSSNGTFDIYDSSNNLKSRVSHSDKDVLFGGKKLSEIILETAFPVGSIVFRDWSQTVASTTSWGNPPDLPGKWKPVALRFVNASLWWHSSSSPSGSPNRYTGNLSLTYAASTTNGVSDATASNPHYTSLWTRNDTSMACDWWIDAHEVDKSSGGVGDPFSMGVWYRYE